MKYATTNRGDGIDGRPLKKGNAVLMLEATEGEVTEILAAAKEIHNKPDPYLEALKASLGLGVMTKEEARDTLLPPFRTPTY